MRPFPIDIDFFNFLESLLFMSISEARHKLNKRYPGYNLWVRINKYGEVRIYNSAGKLLASMRKERK